MAIVSGGFAGLDQVIAEVGLFLQLTIGEANERPAQQDGRGRTDRCVDHGGQDESGSDRPEHAQKGDRRDDGVER